MPSNTTRPNVVLLLTDQERHDLIADDALPVETPAIDRLAADGVRFDRTFTPISICSSARASLLTSLYPHQHTVLNNVHESDAITPDLPPDVPTFGELLADAGYQNTYLGKWHVGRDRTPENFGFSYLGGSDRHHDRTLPSNFRSYQRDLGIDPDEVDLEETVWAEYGDRSEDGDEGDGVLIAGRTPIPVEATRAYYLADRTISRLEEAAQRDGPFFHRTDFLGPHHPYVVPEPYASMYDPSAIEPWPSYAETYADKPQVQENYLANRGVEGFDWAQWAEIVAKYWGFTTLIDDQIGRILDAIDDLGLAEDTVVVHASDHGDFAGNHRQFNKGPFMYDDTYRVPLVVRGPGVDAGRTSDDLVSLLDLPPTFLDLADVSIPARMEGRSLRPLFRGSPDDWREAVFAEYHGDEFGLYTQRMARTDRYKLVYNAPDVDELYDLAADPAELQNLADHPAYRDVRRRLEGLLLDHMRETDDPLYEWTSRVLEGSRVL